MTPAHDPAELADWLRRLAQMVEGMGLRLVGLDVVAGPGQRSVQVYQADLARVPGDSRLRAHSSEVYPWMRVKDYQGIELYALLRDSEVQVHELATLEGA